MTKAGPVVALAGGGTGGHMVPGLALLEELQRRGATPARVVWFQSGRAVEEPVLAGFEERFRETQLDRVALRLEPEGGGAPSLWRTLRHLLPATLVARRALLRSRAEVLVGLGGFTSAPASLAARSLGLRVILLEINAAPGRATRLLAPLAERVLHASALTCPRSGAPRHEVIGAPVSPRFLRRGGPQQAARDRLSVPGNEPLLVVLGGSQGAKGLNAFVRASLPEFLDAGLRVIHQTGPGRLEEAAPASARYQPLEYAREVPDLLLAANLVLCRGGASTLAEIAEVGVPSWVVPYPHHKDRHQELNARILGEGTRVIAEESLGPLVARDLRLLLSPAGASTLTRMEQALASTRPAGAVVRFADAVLGEG